LFNLFEKKYRSIDLFENENIEAEREERSFLIKKYILSRSFASLLAQKGCFQRNVNNIRLKVINFLPFIDNFVFHESLEKI